MPYIVIPSRGLRRPNGATRLLASHPRTNGLRISWAGFQHVGVVPGTANTVITKTGAPTLSASALGLQTQFASGDKFVTSGPAILQSNAQPFTATFYEIPSSVPDYATVGCISLGGQTETCILFRAKVNPYWPFSCGQTNRSAAAIGWGNVQETLLQVAGLPRRFVITSAGGAISTTLAHWNMWVNGIKYPAYTNGISLGTATSPSIGSTHLGGLADFLVADKVWSDAEILNYFRDPYSHYAADPQRIYFGADGTGTTDHSLTASNLTGSAPTLGTPVLTQDHALTATALTSSAPTLGSPAVTQDHVVTASGIVGAAPTLGTPLLAQDHALTTSGLTGAAAILDAPALTAAAALVVENTIHLHTLGEPVLTVAAALVVADVTHAHAADNVDLTAAAALVVADSAHAHTAEAPVLDCASTLVVADAAHVQTSDNVGLSTSGSASLTVEDGAHVHAADNVDLTSASALVVADAVHVQAAEAPALTAASALVVADATHDQASENVTLSLLGAVALLVDDATQAHTAEAIILTSASVLATDNAIHAHFADNVDFSGGVLLIVADAGHAHTAENLGLSLDISIVVADAVQAQTVDDLTGMTLASTLIAQNAVHSHFAEYVVWSFLPPNPHLLYEIAAAARSYQVVVSARGYTVGANSRTYTVRE